MTPRRILLAAFFLLTGGCGLSPNIDLPSADAGDGDGVESNDDLDGPVGEGGGCMGGAGGADADAQLCEP